MRARCFPQLLALAVLFSATSALAVIPSVQAISPTAVSTSSGNFTLTVVGSNFNSSDTITWNGVKLATTLLSGSQAQAVVPAAYVASPGTVQVAFWDSKSGSSSNALSFAIVSSAPLQSSQIGVAPAGCSLGSTNWIANPIGISEAGTFTASFDATPMGNPINASIAFSQSVPAGYSDLAAIVRFNPWGFIDVRSGVWYAGDYGQPYLANSTYHFVVTLNVPARTYSVYITLPDGTQKTLASNYAFRRSQSALNYWTAYQDPSSSNSVQVCNFSLGTTPVAVTTVSVAPLSASLLTGSTQQFAATVTGTTNTAVTWSATGGTISSTGMFTPPMGGGSYTVKATSVADTTKSATATVSVTPVSVSISPINAVVAPGGTQQFSATASGSTNTAVTWSVASGSGTVSNTGLYTAPPTAGSATVMATSVADPSKVAIATVTITAPASVSVSVTPASSTVNVNGTAQFTATVTGSSNTAVSWSASGGTVSSSGLYTAPASAGTYTVRATSAADPSKSASATAAVIPTGNCTLGSTNWVANPLPMSQTGTFSAAFDATPQASAADSSVGLSQNAPAAYTDLAAIVRFNPSGTIDVRNAGFYAADYTQPYSANATYHVVMVVNVAAQTYSVYVTPPGGSQQTLATNYAFRSKQLFLNYWTTYQSGNGPLQVCNFTLGATPVSVTGVSVAPLSASLLVGSTQQFAATVTGTTNTAVTWSATGGTISSTGMFTAPMSGGSYTVKATSVADSTKSANATVNVTQVSVSINPINAVVAAGGTQQFSATASGTANTAVTWSVASGSGTVSNTGLYTAPSTAGSATVMATSVADPTKVAIATVTIAAPVSISVTPASSTINVNGTAQFAASVTGSSNTAVSWSASGGLISSSGLYIAPASAGTYTVRATSAADPTKSASATVTVPAVAGCTLGTSSWVANPLGISQTGSFSATFDATPQANATDADFAFSQNVPAAYTDLAAIVRFNPSGTIDVRNAGFYAADYNQTYSANSTYHFVMVVNVPAHTYSVYVTPPGGTQQALATDYAFRTQSSALNYWTTYQDPSSSGPIQICNLTLSAAPAPPPVTTISITPTSMSMMAGSTQQFTASVTGTTNTAVTWSATGGTVSSTGMFTAPMSGGSCTVKATSMADSTKAASAAVSVASVSVNLNPNNASLTTGGTQQFSATVSGTANTAVTWSLASGSGTVSNTGLYTAASSAGTATVMATSVADSRSSALANVTVSAPTTLLLSASPTSVSFGSVLLGLIGQANLTLSNTGNTAVTVSSASFGGSGFSLSSVAFPFSVPAGSSKSVSLLYSPLLSGPAAGSVSFVSNATNSPATVTLSGTGTAPAQHTVTLNWQSSTLTLSGYNIYRASTGGAYARINSALAPSASYVDSTVQSGQTYSYMVTVVDGSGVESGYSAPVSAAIPTP